MKWFLNMARKLEQSWISEAIRNNPSELRIARLMLVFLGGSAISCVALIGVSAATSESPVWIDFTLLFGHLAVCSSALFIRFSDTMKGPTRLFALLGACQLVAATSITGGPHSNVLFALPVLPIFLSALVDVRTNVTACLIVVLGVSTIFFVDYAVTPFPEVGDSALETLFTHLWVLFMAMLVAVYSQSQANRLLKVAEKELEQRRLAQAELARVNESKDRFLAYMSHEIRNPLTAMVGAAELLSMEKMKAEHPRYLESLKHAAGSLREIVDTVLDFSQIDDGSLRFELSPLALQPFLTELTSQFTATAEASGVSLSCEVAPMTHSAVIADQMRLRQALSNLLSNAIKFSDSGGEVHLWVGPNPEGAEGIKFAVKDTGVGIRSEDQTKIFEAYQRSRGEGLDRKGIGLGLPIARVLLENMGATLLVESELNKGSNFYFVLAAASVSGTSKISSRALDQSVLQGKSVLVAEDNPQAAVVVLGMLSALGCKVHHAKDGKEAVSLYTELQPDFVLMDIQMPNVSGIEAARAIRNGERLSGSKKTYILAITGELHQEEINEGEGFNGLLQKPFSRSDLLKAMSAAG
jgi:signal transduction histidine kinase/BarA-like signal transduction histidine kinase